MVMREASSNSSRPVMLRRLMFWRAICAFEQI